MRVIISSNTSRNSRALRCLTATLPWFLLNAGVALCLDAQVTLKKLGDRDPEIRKATLLSAEVESCFATMDPDEKQCSIEPAVYKRFVDLFLGFLKDSDPAIRRKAAQYLAFSTDVRAVQPFGHLLSDPDVEVRKITSRAFVDWGVSDPKIVRDLEQLLKDQNKFVRINAAMALAFHASRKSLEPVREAYRRETDQEVKGVLAQAVQDLEKKHQ